MGSLLGAFHGVHLRLAVFRIMMDPDKSTKVISNNIF